MRGLAITRNDLTAEQLREAATREPQGKIVRRILAIAMVLDGSSRTAASQAQAMDRQTLRDWVIRYNEQGIAGLADQPRPGRPPSLDGEQMRTLAKWVEQGPDVKQDGVVRWRRIDLCRRIKDSFGVVMHERSVGKVLHRLEFRRISVRPQHPQSDEAAQEDFKKTSAPRPRPPSKQKVRSTARSRSGSRTRRGSASKAR